MRDNFYDSMKGKTVRVLMLNGCYCRPVDYMASSDIYAMPQKSKSKPSPKSSVVNGDDGYGDKSFLRELVSKNAL